MRATWTAWLIAVGLLGIGHAAEAPSAVQAMKAPIKELGTFLGNAKFKLTRGVSGMGSPGGGFSIRGCCSINVERMRTALDTLAKERTDLQRDFERARNEDAVVKLDPLSTSLKTFEEGYKLLLTSKNPEEAVFIMDGLLKSLHAMEAAHGELAACCDPAGK